MPAGLAATAAAATAVALCLHGTLLLQPVAASPGLGLPPAQLEQQLQPQGELLHRHRLAWALLPQLGGGAVGDAAAPAPAVVVPRLPPLPTQFPELPELRVPPYTEVRLGLWGLAWLWLLWCARQFETSTSPPF